MRIKQWNSFLSKGTIIIATILFCESWSHSAAIHDRLHKNLQDISDLLFDEPPRYDYEYEYDDLIVRRYDDCNFWGERVTLELIKDGQVLDRVRTYVDPKRYDNLSWGLYFQSKSVILVPESGYNKKSKYKFKKRWSLKKTPPFSSIFYDEIFILNLLDDPMGGEVRRSTDHLKYLSYLKKSGQWHWMTLGISGLDTLDFIDRDYPEEASFTDVKMRVYDKEGQLLYSNNE